MKRVHLSLTILLGISLFFTSGMAVHAAQPDDVIAKVEDQPITFSEIDMMINSSSIVGLGIPSFGTPERNQLRLTILDKMISANLLYLDAVKKGVEKTPVYESDVQRYADTMLASVYREKALIGEIEVTDQEIRDFFEENIEKGTELTEDVKLAIEATIRKNKFKSKTDAMRRALRKDMEVTINEAELDPAKDDQRKGDTVVARVGGEPVTWGAVRKALHSPAVKASAKERVDTLNKYLDQQIMVKKGREAGLEKDPVYQARIQEFRKVRLVNIHRGKLVDEYTPNAKEIEEYYKRNREKLVDPEYRKVRMIVLKTKDEAKEVKRKVDSGEITIYEAARDYSIHPNAKNDLGEIGWVAQSTGFPELDKLTFSLAPGELGGPVESPAGWHLVMIMDQRDAQHTDIKDTATKAKTRRMIVKEKMDRYVNALRKDQFKVEVYDGVISLLMQQEIDRLKEMREAIGEATSPEEVIVGKGGGKEE